MTSCNFTFVDNSDFVCTVKLAHFFHLNEHAVTEDMHYTQFYYFKPYRLQHSADGYSRRPCQFTLPGVYMSHMHTTLNNI